MLPGRKTPTTNHSFLNIPNPSFPAGQIGKVLASRAEGYEFESHPSQTNDVYS